MSSDYNEGYFDGFTEARADRWSADKAREYVRENPPSDDLAYYEQGYIRGVLEATGAEPVLNAHLAAQAFAGDF